MDTKYRAAIIGCGRISGAHAKAFAESGRYELVAVADIREDAAQTLAAQHGGPAVFSDYRRMLAEVRPDVVSVCTWAGQHAEMTVVAAESGAKGILCEKPMAPSLLEARAMIEAAAVNGTKLAVGHQHRFDPSWVKARELVAAGAIGTPLLAYVRPGDGLLNNGTHFIDGARYILGDPATQWVMAQVERRTDRHERGQPIEDCLAGLVGLAGGVRLLVEVDLPKIEGDQAPPPVVIEGTEGSIHAGWSDLRLFGRDGMQQMDFPKDVPSHVRQAAEFARWLDGSIDDYRDSADKAYETVAVMMGMYESVAAQGAVRFPLEAAASPVRRLIDSGRLPVEVPGKYDIRA
ncbi:MAG: Gfo/Idh/MocA family protein [Anaerolineae bacterium]